MIRPATLLDIPWLLEIEKLSFEPCDRFKLRQFKYAITKSPGNIIVISVEIGTLFTICGYVYFFPSGRIYSLAIHPDTRNVRMGKTLLEEAERQILLANKTHIARLEVRKDNRHAIRFYMKHGYIYTGIKHNYYKDGMDAVLFEKDLRCLKVNGAT